MQGSNASDRIDPEGADSTTLSSDAPARRYPAGGPSRALRQEDYSRTAVSPVTTFAPAYPDTRSRTAARVTASVLLLCGSMLFDARAHATRQPDPSALPLERPDDPPSLSESIVHTIGRAATISFGPFTSI